MISRHKRRKTKMAKKSILLIGAGLRGIAYTSYAKDHPEEFTVTAVADPNKVRRDFIKKEHGIKDEMCFDRWEDVLCKEKLADIAMICTQDKDHFKPCMAAIEAGYDIVLEKPMATTPEECAMIAKAAEEKGVKVVICFVLRYSTFFTALKSLINDGAVGDIMNIDHIEGVGNIHYSHSYTRGNWNNSEESSPMILAKSSHDIDIIQWLLGAKCTEVQSFGSLKHFTRANKPAGSPERCIDGCPYADTCCYNSVKLYLDDKNNTWFRTAATNTSDNPSDELVEKALRETNYGKCVYSCTNNVVDHQTVNLLYDNGSTATFTMSAFNHGGRIIRVMGTKGELSGSPEETFMTYYNFETGERTNIEYAKVVSKEDLTGGHGGGDIGLMCDLAKYLGDHYDGFSMTPIAVSADNHITTFAAEYSRVNGGKTVNLEEYKKMLLEG